MVFEQFEIIAAVDALFPFVALDIDDDYRFAVASGIEGGIHLCHSAGNGRIYRCRDEATGLGYQCTHFHLVAALDDSLCRSAYMLREGEDSLLGQRSHNGGRLCRELVLFRMDTSYAECSYFHTVSCLVIMF